MSLALANATASTPAAASVLARLPNTRTASAILERHRTQDRARIARNRDKLVQVRELKAAKADALTRRAYFESFEHRNQLYKEQTTGYDDKGNPIVERTSDPALQEINIEIAVIEERLAALMFESDPPCMTAGRLEVLLSQIPPDAEITENYVTPNVGARESKADALAKIRRTIVAKREARDEIARKHRTRDEVKAAVRSQINFLAGRGVPKVRPALEGGSIEFTKIKLPGTVGHEFQYIADGVALVCWLFEKELLRRVDELIDFNADPANALGADEKVCQLSELDSELMTLRRVEASLVEAIVADGGTAWHFPDAPVEALFSITVA
jgi:hypothetical protein